LDKREILVKELIDEIDTMKHVIEEVGEQKEEELRLAVSAVYELASRNSDLEREIMTLKGGHSTWKPRNKVLIDKKPEKM